MTTAIERAARAIDAAEIGYSIRLVSLIDGVSTYTLQYDDGSPMLEFPSHGDAAEHVRDRLHIARAHACLASLLPPSPEMVEVGGPIVFRYDSDDDPAPYDDLGKNAAAEIFTAMIEKALEG